VDFSLKFILKGLKMLEHFRKKVLGSVNGSLKETNKVRWKSSSMFINIYNECGNLIKIIDIEGMGEEEVMNVLKKLNLGGER
jgi:hypothetical protein